MPQLSPRKGMPSPRLSAAEFRERFLSQFQDPSFEPLASPIVGLSRAPRSVRVLIESSSTGILAYRSSLCF